MEMIDIVIRGGMAGLFMGLVGWLADKAWRATRRKDEEQD